MSEYFPYFRSQISIDYVPSIFGREYDVVLAIPLGVGYAFFVTTHIDRPHVHNHIYYNSTSLDCTRKFRDFLGSAKAVRRLSDRVCLENGLSIVEHPKLPSRGKFQHYGEWQQANGGREPTFQERLTEQIDRCLAAGPESFDAFLRMMEAAGFEIRRGRGGAISFRNPVCGQERFTRLRASTLGEGYGPEDIRAIIAKGGPLPGRASLPRERRAPKRFELVIDIQERMRAGKGPAYEHWAKIHNLKQMAAALQYLQENDLMEDKQLSARAMEATDRFHTLEWQINHSDAV